MSIGRLLVTVLVLVVAPMVATSTSAQTANTTGSTDRHAGNNTQLEADGWVESWYRKDINIYKIQADSERQSAMAFVKMWYNFTVVAYVPDTQHQFHYVVRVDGDVVKEGDATWKFDYTTSVSLTTFNLTMDLSQNNLTKHYEWAHILATPGADAPIGEGNHIPSTGPTEPGVLVTVGFLTDFQLKNIMAVIAAGILAFYLVGNWWLEKMDKLGYRRFI